MYRVMTDAEGKFILTVTGGRMPFWFSDYRYESYLEALFLTPDIPD